jgi:sugar phosphate isomerase/epimerase
MQSILDRLGILTDEVSPNFKQALAWIAEQGLKYVEVRVIDGTNAADLDDQRLAAVRRQVESHGLFVAAISSPLFKCALDPSRPVASGDRFGQAEQDVEAHFVRLERVINIAKQLSTRRIRIFSFWREIDPTLHTSEIVKHLSRAAKIAEREGIVLLLENEPSCNGGFAGEVGGIVEAVQSAALQALWDPGNEAYGGREAFPAGYQQIKKTLGHVHMKDAYIRPDGSPRCVPLGSGNVQWILQLRALVADGYNGLFTIETHFTPEGGSSTTGSLMTLDALRAMVKEV